MTRRGRSLPAGAALLAAALMLTGSLAGCVLLGGGQQQPDQRYGHRYEGRAPDGRMTLSLAPVDSSDAYFVYPAPVGRVIVRTPPADPPMDTSTVPAEVLVKGALPETCMRLHEAEQERVGHLVRVTLTVRVPRGMTCERTLRPYRFYLPLEGRFARGPYTLLLNGEAYPFAIDLDGEAVVRDAYF